MALRRFEMTVVSDGAGAATAFSPYLSGYIHAIHYIKTDYAAGVDFTITAEATGESIWTQLDVDATVTKAPRQITHSTLGAPALYVAAGTNVNDRIVISRDRVKIVLAAAGATKTGKFIIVVDG